MAGILMNVFRYDFHACIIYGQINEDWDKGGRESELYSFEEFKFLILNSGDCEGHRMMIRIFASFKSCRNRVKREQNGISDPVPER